MEENGLKKRREKEKGKKSLRSELPRCSWNNFGVCMDEEPRLAGFYSRLAGSPFSETRLSACESTVTVGDQRLSNGHDEGKV